MRNLIPAVTLVLLAFSSIARPESREVIVDNPDAELKGSWQTVKDGGHFVIGPNFNYAMGTEGEATASATYHPDIKATSKYDIDVYYGSGKNRSPHVPYLISCADGETVVYFDQSHGGNGWTRLASNKTFNAGTAGYVQIRNNSGILEKIIVADAIRFVPAGTEPAATAAVAGFTLHLGTEGNGTVKKSPDRHEYSAGTVVKLTAEPDSGSTFSGWAGDVSGSENSVSITMNRDKNVTAQFTSGSPGVILEAADAQFTGEWIDNAGKWGAYAKYRYTPTCGSEIPANSVPTATYHPKLTKSGLYDVYIWYSQGANRAPNAVWEVACKNDKRSMKVNQQVNGGNWFQIGSGLPFDAGTNGYVRVTAQTGQAGHVVVADAVAFVYTGN